MARKDREAAGQVATEVEGVAAIDPLFLKEEFTKISATLAHYNEQYAEALRQHLRAKRRSDETYARVYLEKREAHTGEKMTETTLKSMVETDEDYEQACNWAIEAEVAKVRAAGRCEALRAKKDALISLGAHVRAELSGDPRMRDYQNAVDSKDG